MSGPAVQFVPERVQSVLGCQLNVPTPRLPARFHMTSLAARCDPLYSAIMNFRFGNWLASDVNGVS